MLLMIQRSDPKTSEKHVNRSELGRYVYLFGIHLRNNKLKSSPLHEYLDKYSNGVCGHIKFWGQKKLTKSNVISLCGYMVKRRLSVSQGTVVRVTHDGIITLTLCCVHYARLVKGRRKSF